VAEGETRTAPDTCVAAARGAVLALKISPIKTETPWSLRSQRAFRAPIKGSPSESWSTTPMAGAETRLCSPTARSTPFASVLPNRA
jgi:hypothetical protein